MLAMTAARLGEPERAVDALLLDTPKKQRRFALRHGAGRWLGWRAKKKNAPGFPDNGQWTVRWENLRPAP